MYIPEWEHERPRTLSHPVDLANRNHFVAIIWPLLLLAIFVPLAVRRYRRLCR
jgi:hypothetical protein